MKRGISLCVALFCAVLFAYSQEHEFRTFANYVNMTYHQGEEVVDYVGLFVSTGLAPKQPLGPAKIQGNNGYFEVLVDTNPSDTIWPKELIRYKFQYGTELIIEEISTESKGKEDVKKQYPFEYNTYNPYGNNASLKPSLKASTATNYCAGNTYALIVNAVYNEYANYEEYWNECSFMYQTLHKRYGIPRSNIKVLMANATPEATGIQVISADRKSLSTMPLDLDGDGIRDVDDKASTTSLSNAIEYYRTNLTKYDQLFIFIVGDCEFDPTNYTRDVAGKAYLRLWNEEIPDKYDHSSMYNSCMMANELWDCQAKVFMLLDICESDRFVTNLQDADYIGGVATSGRYSIAPHSQYPYGEFIFNWLCGMNYTTNIHVNGATAVPYSYPFDPNNNGVVTMKEAYDYAKGKSTYTNNCAFESDPWAWGKYMAFNDVPRDVALMIRDRKNDTGTEYISPSLDFLNQYSYNSPDVYLRNQQDGQYVSKHDTLVLTQSGKKAYIYAKVLNLTDDDYPGQGQFLHLFWADSRNLGIPAPLGAVVDNVGRDTTMYGLVATVPVTHQIAWCDSLLLCGEWAVPSKIYAYKNQYGKLPPLAFVAVLSEKSTLPCGSLQDVTRYAKIAAHRMYVAMKGEIPYTINNPIIGPGNPGIQKSPSVTLVKPEDDGDDYYYESFVDDPDVSVSLTEDEQFINIELDGEAVAFADAETVLHVVKRDAVSDECVGGVDIVLTNDATEGNTPSTEYNGTIKSVSGSNGKLTVNLTEPVAGHVQVMVEAVGSSITGTTYSVEVGQSEITVPCPADGGNMWTISLLVEEKLKDSVKFIQ